MLTHDHVAALLPAEAAPGHLHALEDVLVSDRRSDDVPPGRLDGGLQAAVRQHRHDEAAAGQGVALEAVQGQDPEHLIAVDDVAARVDRDEAVGIAVEREADVGAALDHGPGERGRIGRPALDVDVDAVRGRRG